DPARPVAEGKMLRPLFDALAVLVIRLPPLRVRPDDLPALADALLRRTGAPARELTAEAWECVRAYAWPGNLRELSAALARAKGNQSRAAELLSVWRPRLLRRIKALGLEE